MRVTCLFNAMLNFSSMTLCVEYPTPNLSYWIDCRFESGEVRLALLAKVLFLATFVFLFLNNDTTLIWLNSHSFHQTTVFVCKKQNSTKNIPQAEILLQPFWRAAFTKQVARGFFRLVSALRIWSSQSIRPPASLVAPAVLSSFAVGDVAWCKKTNWRYRYCRCYWKEYCSLIISGSPFRCRKAKWDLYIYIYQWYPWFHLMMINFLDLSGQRERP